MSVHSVHITCFDIVSGIHLQMQKCFKIIFKLQMFTISKRLSECAFHRNYLQTGDIGKQTVIRDDFNQSLFQYANEKYPMP